MEHYQGQYRELRVEHGWLNRLRHFEQHHYEHVISRDLDKQCLQRSHRPGQRPIGSERKRIELLPEERQAIRYARGKEVAWAILTNFERLIVFDADDQRPVLT